MRRVGLLVGVLLMGSCAHPALPHVQMPDPPTGPHTLYVGWQVPDDWRVCLQPTAWQPFDEENCAYVAELRVILHSHRVVYGR